MCDEKNVEVSKIEGYWLGLCKALEIVEIHADIEQVEKQIKTEVKKANQIVANYKVEEIETFIKMVLELRYTKEGVKEISG